MVGMEVKTQGKLAVNWGLQQCQAEQTVEDTKKIEISMSCLLFAGVRGLV